MAVIGIIATLDTKGEEAAYLRDLIEKDGYQVLMLDSGLLYRPSVCADISRQEILSKAGVGSLEEYRKNGKAVLQRAMTVGLKAVMKELYEGKKIQGVISIGGAQGSAVSAAAMQVLPVGFPKVMISTIACGTTRFGDYVGSRDIAMIPSIVDICGLNSITIPVFREGAGMVMGMVRMRELALAENDALEEKPTAALTMAGVTTDCVMRVKKLLEKRGFETIVCHCNGVGAEIIDEMAEAGKLAGVIDITPHEVGGMLWDGLIQCRKGRFENVYNSGIPVITLPGALDFILKGPKEELTEEYKNRPCYEHTPFHTHIRTNYREM